MGTLGSSLLFSFILPFVGLGTFRIHSRCDSENGENMGLFNFW